MIARKNKMRIPHEKREDGSEDERKYEVLGINWLERVTRLHKIFAHVVNCNSHFVTLNAAPHTEGYDPELLSTAKPPIETLALRTRFYMAGKKLKGYRPSDKKKGELRIEEKTGKAAWQQVLKLGGDGSRTLKRGEHKRLLDGAGYNFNVYSKDIAAQAEDVLGKRLLKRLVRLQGQSEKILYHPEGRQDVLFEIKFDQVKGLTFDGQKKKDLIEIEIEVKERGSNVSDDEIETMLNKSEDELMKNFADDIRPIYHSKVSELFQHLYGWMLQDPQGFGRAFDALPARKWAEMAPHNSQ